MKLQPPEVQIPDSDPFANDIFKRRTFAESLSMLIAKAEENLVVFVNAPWGEGKTTFCKMWLASLKNSQRSAIYFDAFAADYFDDPFVSFSGEIVAFLKKTYPDDKGSQLTKDFTATAISVGKKLAGTLLKVGVSAATAGVVNAARLDEFSEAAKEIAKGVGEAGEEFLKAKIEDYEKERASFTDFKMRLCAVAKRVRDAQGFPLTIIVDELDRCRPDYALTVLERIKHLFDVPNVVFILFINRKQIESYTSVVFGDKVEANDYLQKFGHLHTDLPQSVPTELLGERLKFCENLDAHYGLTIEPGNLTFAQGVTRISDHFRLSLRDIQRVYAVAATYYAQAQKNTAKDAGLVSLLIVLKVKKPLIYKRLLEGSIEYHEFRKESGINDEFRDNRKQPNADWYRQILQYCLERDGSFKGMNSSAQSNLFEHASRTLDIDPNDRTGTISRYCRKIDLFRVG